MSTLDKKLTDITEGAAMDASGEKSLGAAPACEPQRGVPALEARHLTLVWGNGQVVAQDISIELQPGTITCLVGRSGCGKTTLLQIHLYRSLEMFCSFHIAVFFRLSVMQD